MEIQDLLEIPYEERKYIYIIENQQDRLIQELAEEFEVNKKKKKRNFILGGLAIAGGPIVAAGVGTGVAITKVIQKRKQSSATKIHRVTRDQVFSILFPGDGMPISNMTYICNPVDTRRYYMVNDFHREIINHKVYEAVYLLRSLGATEINIQAREETNRNLDLDLSFGMGLGSATSGNNFHENQNKSIKYNATYKPSGKAPFIPDDIYWIDHEHQWLNIANERINHGLTSFELDVDASSDFGINSELAIQLKEGNNVINGNIKGNYKGFKRTSLFLSGKFSD